MPRYGLFVMRLRGPAVMVLHGLRQGTVPLGNWSRIRVLTISYTFTAASRLRPEWDFAPKAHGRRRRPATGVTGGSWAWRDRRFKSISARRARAHLRRRALLARRRWRRSRHGHRSSRRGSIARRRIWARTRP